MTPITLRTPRGAVQARVLGDGPTLVVVLHASATGPRSLQALAEGVATPGRRVVAPALQGYDGTRLDAADPLSANIIVTQAVVDHFRHERCALFGHSMGGLAAISAVATGVRVDGLAVFEPILVNALHADDADDMALLAWDQRVIATLREAVATGEPERGVAAFVRAWNELDWATLPQPVRDKLIESAPLLVAETAATNIAAPPADNIAASVRHLLLLRGSRSPPLAHRMLSRFADRAGGLPVRVLHDCGHMAPLMAAGRVAAELTVWLEAIEQQQGGQRLP